MHCWPEVTLVGGKAHYVFCRVISFILVNVCGIRIPATIQSDLIIHVSCECSWSRGVQYCNHFATGLIMETKHDSYTEHLDGEFQQPMGRFTRTQTDLKLFVLWEWHHLRLPTGSILVNTYPLEDLLSIQQCMPPVCSTLCFNFNYRCDIWTSEHICSLDYFSRLNIFSVIFSFIRCWILMNYFLYNVLFLFYVIWYDRGERWLFNYLSTCLHIDCFQTSAIHSITYYNMFVFLSAEFTRIIYTIYVYMKWTQNHPRSIILPYTHRRCCNRNVSILILSIADPTPPPPTQPPQEPNSIHRKMFLVTAKFSRRLHHNL